jgi:UDP-glucose 4-epimerase
VNQRVLVTGGAGFIGANLVRLLLEGGYEVSVLDDFSTGRRQYLNGLQVRVIEADVRDAERTAAAVEHDSIVHLAAQAGVPSSLVDPRRDCEVNVLGTLNLLEAARDKGVSRFVFASSNAPLGRQAPPASEDKAALPVSPYGASKLAGEGYCCCYNGSWGLGTVALRFGNVYGPFSAHKSSVVARFFTDIQRDGRVVVEGDGRQTRDFVYVGDLCTAIVLALESHCGGETFQIATGVETSIAEVAEIASKVSGRTITTDRREPRRGDVRRSYSSIAKADTVLGWRPTVSLGDGLAATWEWFAR